MRTNPLAYVGTKMARYQDIGTGEIFESPIPDRCEHGVPAGGECRRCNGSGYVTVRRCPICGQYKDLRDFETASGQGWVPHETCRECLHRLALSYE